MVDYILKTNGLSKTYKHGQALKQVNMHIKRGDIYGFIGENGAGKTTLIRMITGLGFPTDGEIELFGKLEDKELSAARKRIGCLIESPALFLDMSARQNLEVQRVQRGIPGKACVDEVLALVNLTTTGKKKVKNFSLGMKQRLALAIALLGDPEFLILDEPVNGLDPSGIIEFRNLLKRINEEKKMTILISSHLLSELHQLATCYGIIHQGRLIEEISSEALDDKCNKYIYLQVENSQLAASILETELRVTNFKIYPNDIIKIYDIANDIKKISHTLMQHGVGIEELKLQSDSLETYFTKVIGGYSHE